MILSLQMSINICLDTFLRCQKMEKIDMASKKEESKRLERRARSLLMTKKISPSQMELVRSLMANKGVDADDRNRTIIGLLQASPDKITETSEAASKVPESLKKAMRKKKDKERKATVPPGDHSPTETSFYIDKLLRKYKSTKLFKVRHLVKRKNRFNIGLRKRLIPTKRFMQVLADIYSMQDEILNRLSVITMDILNDDDIDNPVCFNYLRLIRAWLTMRPLENASYSNVKWMERAGFEREFKEYLYNTFSIQRVSNERKDEIIKLVESKLMLMPDLKKDDIFEADATDVKRNKEKRNAELDKQTMAYLMLLRAFLFSEDDDTSVISARLRQNYGIGGYAQFLMMIIEVLIYQRPIKLEDFIYKFEVRTADVSPDEWNYSEEYLKKIGKDKSTRRQKRQVGIKDSLAFYDGIYALLRLHDGDTEVVPKCVGIQWRQIDKNKNNPDTIFTDDFPVFLDGMVRFFSNTFIPFINGSSIIFKANDGKEFSSALFEKEFFADELKSFKQILEDLHKFRSENPMLIVSRNEVVKIMRGQIISMNHVEKVVRSVGDFFYNVARRLFPYYDMHRRWLAAGSPDFPMNTVRRPLAYTLPSIESRVVAQPFPFYDCIITGFDKPGVFTKVLEDKKLIGGIPGEGIVGYALAYCYQSAGICLNAELANDMSHREQLVKRLKDIP